MSKSRQPSAAVSPSASASSHDTHSLPPNFKGVVQRYLAVSLPTVTFSPELIEALDRADVIIPSRIKVTMRWRKEDASSSLSVYPNINGSLPPAIEGHQLQLRLEQGILGSQLQPRGLQTQAQTPPRLEKSDLQPQTRSSSAVAGPSASSLPFKKPWVGARFFSALRRRKDSQARAPHPQPQASPLAGGDLTHAQNVAISKPLPMLPPAAFPLTVAYPVRCSLEQLCRYFQELSVLTLDIHITPDLVASTAIPNLSDLFHNINGTFSGVFPFTHVAKDISVSFANENLFQSGIALGMVVFQAWAQDTSQVSETSEESESASTASMPLPQHEQKLFFNSRRSQSHAHHQGNDLSQQRDLDLNHRNTKQDRSRQLHPSIFSKGLSRDPLLLDHHHQSPPLSSIHPLERHYRHVIEESTPLTRHSGDQKLTIPEPVIDLTTEGKISREVPQAWTGIPLPYENRRNFQDAHKFNAVYSQTSRSRPRSGATAAAIGRLDAVLSRGQDLLQGMRTSLAMDPVEVHARSSKPPRTSNSHNLGNDKLPYWPSKSRFILELAIPTAYLTTHGLLKGPGRSTGFRQHFHRGRGEKDPGLSNQPLRTSDPKPHSTAVSSNKEPVARSLRRSAAPIPFGVSFPSTVQPTEKFSKSSLHKMLKRGEEQQPPLSHSNKPPDYLRKSNPQPLPTLQPSLLTHQGYKRSTSHRNHLSGDTSKPQKRRLSSNDRLQIRMNPRAGELFGHLPDLFAGRSMSALLRPECPSSSEGSYATKHESSVGGATSDATESSSPGSSRFERRGLSGRQSRLQKRPKESTTSWHGLNETARDRRTNAYSKATKMKSQANPVHAQHFNFKAQCPLALTPEIMAAYMLENISVELWKLNHKRQTMVELGTAKLPLHKILGRIMQKDVALSSLHFENNFEPERRRAQRRRANKSRSGKDCGPCREGWRLEPSLYDIRSRHGTVIGQLDADIWIHPRSRSSSFVSAAA